MYIYFSLLIVGEKQGEDSYAERHVIWKKNLMDTHTITLITSDKEGSEGNGHSHGHFHCGAPLAICPIYAFNTHKNTHAYKHLQTCKIAHIYKATA